MQDNSTNDIIEMLTRYMDGELTSEEKFDMEERLKNDVALQERYQHLLATRQAIRMQGLKQRVQAIQKEYLQEIHAEKADEKTTGRISVLRTFMRVAAIFILIVAGYGLFQYTTTTNDSVFNDNFISYAVPVSRGNESTGSIDELYNTGKYNEVIQSFDTLSIKKPQDYFIVAQAYLHLNNTEDAIDNFRQLENLNNVNSEKYFVEETDYYLMLAYIKNGNINEAEKKLNKITSDKQHLFFSKAKNISRSKFTILQWKNSN